MGCSKTSAPEQAAPALSASAEPVPSAGSAVSRASAAPAESVPPAPSADPSAGKDFVLYREVNARFFPVGKAVLACGLPCTYPAKPNQKVWLIEDGTAQERPELWPKKIWSEFDTTLTKNDLVPELSYGGAYPLHLWAWAGTDSRTGDGTLPHIKFAGKFWVRSEEAYDPQRPLPPRKYDELLLSVPSPDDPTRSFVYGGGAPPMVVPAHMLFTYRKGKWQKRYAPWGENPDVTRLANGNTVVITEFSYLVTPDEQIRKLEVEEKHARAVARLGATAWLIGGLKLSKPVHPEEFKLAPLERRKAARPVQQELSAASPPGDFHEDPAEYTAECKAPLIEIRSNSHTPYEYYHEVRKVLKQHPEEAAQLVAYRAHLKSGYALLLRAKDMAGLKQVQGWLQEIGSADLKCQDLEALMPDPYAPSAKLRRVFFHPWSYAMLKLAEPR